MGAKLPVISGQDAVRVFVRFGWTVARQASSHIILIKPGGTVTLSVPIIAKWPKERSVA